jgi:hypothetical protein
LFVSFQATVAWCTTLGLNTYRVVDMSIYSCNCIVVLVSYCIHVDASVEVSLFTTDLAIVPRNYNYYGCSWACSCNCLSYRVFLLNVLWRGLFLGKKSDINCLEEFVSVFWHSSYIRWIKPYNVSVSSAFCLCLLGIVF